MRILIDIPEEDLKLLDLAVKRLSISAPDSSGRRSQSRSRRTARK
jgi:hypothetical protein